MANRIRLVKPVFICMLINLFLGMPLAAQNDIQPYAIRTELLSQNPQYLTPPQDSQIGRVAIPAFDGYQISPELFITLRAFLDNLKNGKILDELVWTDLGDTFILTLKEDIEGQDQVFVRYRLGIPLQTGSVVSVPLKLFGYNQSVSGTAYLIYDDEQWLIDEIEIPFEDLYLETESRPVLEPSSRWNRLFGIAD